VPDVEAHITGTVWKVEVEIGDTVEPGDTVVVLESMKMEMPVEAETAGARQEAAASLADNAETARVDLGGVSFSAEQVLGDWLPGVVAWRALRGG